MMQGVLLLTLGLHSYSIRLVLGSVLMLVGSISLSSFHANPSNVSPLLAEMTNCCSKFTLWNNMQRSTTETPLYSLPRHPHFFFCVMRVCCLVHWTEDMSIRNILALRAAVSAAVALSSADLKVSAVSDSNCLCSAGSCTPHNPVTEHVLWLMPKIAIHRQLSKLCDEC